MQKIFIFSLCLFFAVMKLYAQQVKVSGRVFEDKNQNGEYDTKEKGIKGILISNGETMVATDKNGNYTIEVPIGSSVFPILPSNYTMQQQIVNASFLYIDSIYQTRESAVHNIALVPQKVKSDFRIGAIGDIQMKDHQEMNYANQTIIAELMVKDDIDFNIFLGDQINETLDILPPVKQMIESLPMPSWLLVGNHDRNVHVTKNQDDVFNRFFGASYYSFNYGDVHFIVLNNIYTKGGRDYTGQIDDRQLAFVQNDLKHVPKSQTIVVSQHIPMVYTKNKDSFLELVKDYSNVLVLSGHTHQISRHILAPNVHELVAGATCGNWWVGERDWQAIPTALMQCGSPKNYFTIDFSKDDYKINYKGVGLSEDRQMDIWIGGQDTVDVHIDKLVELGDEFIVANIYGGSDSTVVMMQVDAGDWVDMTHTSMVAPNVNRLIHMNSQRAFPSLYSRRGALRRRDSPHIWKGALPSGLVTGMHSIKIKAKDDYGFEVTGSRLFFVK